MDQQRLYEFTSRIINGYDTRRETHESNVTAIADLLLDCGDKDGRHGYIRKSEAIIRHLNPNVAMSDEGNNRRPDKAVLQKDEIVIEGDLIHVINLNEEEKVLIVECKSDHDFNRRAEDQVKAYMILADFPHGLLLSQKRAVFFRQMGDQGIQEVHNLDNIKEHVEEIANIIREM